MVTVASWISRPFGPYHSPPASNWGDWWVVLGLDPLRSDWSEIGGWVRSLAGAPNVWCVRSASTDLQFGLRTQIPFSFPVGLTWCGFASVEMGPSGLSRLTNAVRQLADSSGLRSSPNVWDDRSGLSDVFARRAFRPTDWHNCFGPWVLTGDLVLADNRRFPLFLHARAVALSMPEPSLGAPVPSRSLLFGVELFDRFARPWASVSRFARIAPPPAGFVVARRHRLAFCLISPCHPRRPRRVSILERQ